MPQALPLQPLPESDQERTAPGLEPGTGVRVATMAAVKAGLEAGGRGKLQREVLAMATAVKFCFGGISDAGGGQGDAGSGGEMAGAVVISLASMAPQLFGQAGPERLQRMAEIGLATAGNAGVEGLQRTEFDGRGNRRKRDGDVAGDGPRRRQRTWRNRRDWWRSLVLCCPGRSAGAVKIPIGGEWVPT